MALLPPDRTGKLRDFEGRTALVTGGSRGIGRAIALEFARRGADVAFNYRSNSTAAEQTRRDVESEGVRCVSIRAHLGDSDKIRQMFSRVEAEFGALDVLVNNAASGVQRPAGELREKHWDWAMDINAKAPWLCAIEASRLMIRGGSVVNITSQGSQKVLPYYFSVGVSKAALESMTRYLAVELAEKGISVNAVSGGYVETGAFDSFPNRDEMVSATENTLDGRSVTGEDIARVVAFLCTDAARMIRGQVLVVDGGVSLTI